MKTTNCLWELDNLGKRVAEVTLDDGERVDDVSFRQLEDIYDYIVVKAPPCNAPQYKILADLGYSFIESQITVTKLFSEGTSFTPPENYLHQVSNALEMKTA